MANNEIVVPLEYQLRRIADRIKVQGRSNLIAHHISEQQFIAIQWLSEGVMTVGQLAQRMGLAVSTTSEMVDQLIVKGCVRREKDQFDKRKVNINLEQKSFEIIEEVITKRQQFLAGLMDEFSLEEKMILTQSVNRLYMTLKEEHHE